jgi:RimJ/RimL family protein N-acetyltransferase
MSQFALRPVEVADLDAIFEQMRDPESVRMAAFTPEVQPIRARAASDNAGSLRVLQKAGLHPIGTEVSFAPRRAAEIEETILELP